MLSIKNLRVSRKQIQIDRARTVMYGSIIVASITLVTGLIFGQKLMSQNIYQQRVIKARKDSLKQLKSNVQASKDLSDAYKSFDAAEESVLGTKDKNSRLILDALPSKYDYPAMISSVEKLLSDKGYIVESVSGEGDQEGTALQTSSQPKPIEIPFGVTTRTSFDLSQRLMLTFENSIRPIAVSELDLNGNDSQLRLTIKAKTYYQPERVLDIQTKVVK